MENENYACYWPCSLKCWKEWICRENLARKSAVFQAKKAIKETTELQENSQGIAISKFSCLGTPCLFPVFLTGEKWKLFYLSRYWISSQFAHLQRQQSFFWSWPNAKCGQLTTSWAFKNALFLLEKRFIIHVFGVFCMAPNRGGWQTLDTHRGIKSVWKMLLQAGVKSTVQAGEEWQIPSLSKQARCLQLPSLPRSWLRLELG